MVNIEGTTKSIQGKVLDDNIDEAILEVLNLANKTQDKGIIHNAILLKSRYSSLKNEAIRGLVNENQSTKELNHIKSSILNILSDIRNKVKSPEATKSKIVFNKLYGFVGFALIIGLCILIKTFYNLNRYNSYYSVVNRTYKNDLSQSNDEFLEKAANKSGKLVYNIPEGMAFLRLVFASQILHIEEQIIVPSSITAEDLKNAIIENYRLKDRFSKFDDVSKELIKAKSIEWLIFVNHQIISKENISLEQLQLKDNDIISVKLALYVEYMSNESGSIADVLFFESRKNTVKHPNYPKPYFHNDAISFSESNSNTADSTKISNDSILLKPDEKITPKNLAEIKSDTISTSVINLDTATIFMSNVITPNGDGLNDYFYVTTPGSSKQVLITRFAIYDHFGKLIFERKNFLSNSEEYRWDGTYNGLPALQGTYYYIIENEMKVKRSGILILLR